MAKWQTVIIEKFWLLGAILVEGIDKVLDQISWGITYFGIKILRYLHDVRMTYLEYKRPIMHGALYFIITGVLAIFLFAHAIDYSYSYNGRMLGTVKEQGTVLEILDLVSEELTQEYGLPIAINAESDITFKPVLSFGKELDTPDTVLRKFTYMGDIQTKGFAIYVDGTRIGTVESDEVGQDILHTVISKYLKGKEDDYEYVGITEKVEIKEMDTTLSKVTNKNSILKLVDNGIDKEFTYTAKEDGAKVKTAAEELGVSVKTLREQNPQIGKDKTLKEGDKLTVTKKVPAMTVKTVGIETFAEVIEYETEIIKSDEYYEDEEFIRQNGSNGKQKVTSRVTRINGEVSEREDLETEVITAPVKKIVVKGTKKVPPRQGTGTFIRPVGGVVTGYFGWRWGRMHEGVDFGVSTGTSVHASDGGTVIVAGWYYAYGLSVKIDHGGGYTTLYAHNSSLLVHVGDRVYQGQIIARSGSTGRSTGPHVHFEIRKNGVAQNPLNYI